MTDGFAAAWALGVEGSLRRYLASCGLAPEDIDDIVQDTAIRAMESGAYAGSTVDLRRWAFVVAKRLAVDLHRSRRRLVAVHENDLAYPDVDQEDELARVEDRQLLRTVLAAAATLSPGERMSLRPCAEGTATERNRVNAARYRARKRLRFLVGPLAAVIAWTRRQGDLGAFGGTVATALAVPLVALTSGGHGGEVHTSASSQHEQVGQRTVTLVAQTLAVRTPVSPIAYRQVSRARTVSRPLTSSRTDRIVAANGPGSSRVAAWNDAERGHEPLVCAGLDQTTRQCVRLPSGLTVKSH